MDFRNDKDSSGTEIKNRYLSHGNRLAPQNESKAI